MFYAKSYVGLSIVVFCGFLLPSPAPAQCVDGSTTIYWVNHLWRTASNNVDALAGTQIVGDYWYTWAGSISSTEQVGSTTIDSGYAGVGYGGNNGFIADGTAAGLQWDDSPSTSGAGAYGLSNSHVAWSQCGDYYPYSTSDSLTVNKPTMTGYNAVWYLSNGQNQTGYANITYETAQSNCGASDTCNDTPSWTATGNTGEISFSCNPCAVQTVNAQARSNTFQDIQISVNLAGFGSDPMPFTVYAPYRITCCNLVNDSAVGDGFFTEVHLDLYDVFGDHLLYLALNESFSYTLNPDYQPFSGYGQPTASGVAAGWGGYPTWRDVMAAHGGCLNASPQCTNPQFAIGLSSTKAFHNLQNWFVGSANPGQGVWVREDIQQFYVDHGRYSFEYSPVYP